MFEKKLILNSDLILKGNVKYVFFSGSNFFSKQNMKRKFDKKTFHPFIKCTFYSVSH